MSDSFDPDLVNIPINDVQPSQGIQFVCEKIKPPCIFVFNITTGQLNFITVPRILLFMDMEFPWGKGSQIEKSWKFPEMGKGVNNVNPHGKENPGEGGGGGQNSRTTE